jgi:uncharacterized membrane protein YeaQ/YmgE (transglycosylase-associated protein family)
MLAISGLIVGALGRLLVPGPTPMGILGTIAAGIAGSFIGGFVGRLLFGAALTAGWLLILSIVGAALVVALVSGRGHYYRSRPVVVDDGYGYGRRRRFF